MISARGILVGAFLGVFTTIFLSAEAVADFRVEAFSPQGNVRDVRQVHVRFSEEAVAFGDPRDRDAPFTTDCPQTAQSRWVDGRNWVHEYKEQLPGGVRCVFNARPSLKSLAGQPLTGESAFIFSTGGATPLAVYPGEGFRDISPDQVFILALDAPADPSSVEQHAYFEVEGIASRVEVSVLPAGKTSEIAEDIYRSVWPEQSGSVEETAKIAEGIYLFRRMREKPKIGLRAKQRFPPGRKIRLIWARDIETPGGVPTGRDEHRAFDYTSAPPFTVSVRCRRKDESEGCDPLGEIRLVFSSFVDAAQVAEIKLMGGPRGKRVAEPRSKGATRHAVFHPPFPPNTEFRVVIPENLRSMDGRSLPGGGSGTVEIATGDFPPLAKFSGRFGILEREDSPVLPVTIRNLEPDLKVRSEVSSSPAYGLRHWLQDAIRDLSGRTLRLSPDQSGHASEQRREIVRYMQKLHAVDGVAQYRNSLIGGQETGPSAERLRIPPPKGRNRTEVVGIPLEDPGFYIVEIASRNLAEQLLNRPDRPVEEPPKYMYAATGALVTNMSAHLKRGRENALIWVTRLNDAEPVQGAKVSVLNCRGEEIWIDETNADGVAISKTPLPETRCSLRPYQSGLFVFAEHRGDVTFAHSSWDDGIEVWRFPGTRHSTANRQTPLIGHTVLGRSLFRAGETVSMKHFLRRHRSNGMDVPDTLEAWNSMEIIHRGSGQKFQFNLDWDALGIAQTTWTIPNAAKLGTYTVSFKKKKKKRRWKTIITGSFDVQEFKVPLTRGTIKGPETKLVRATSFPLDFGVRYLAGGGAGGLPVKLRSQFTEARSVFRSKGYPGFAFNAGAPRKDPWKPERRTLAHTALKLDDAGTGRYTLSDIPASDKAVNVLTEMSYRDPNGNIRTVVHRETVHPSRWNVGIKAKSWIPKDGELSFTAVLLDLDGTPVPGKSLGIDLVKQEHLSHRKKLAGGIYGYEHEVKLTPLGPFCEGTTDDDGRLTCAKRVEHSGKIYGVARVDTPEGIEQVTHAGAWVPGKDAWWFRASDTDQMDVLPEKRSYEPGDTARFQVRMPFRKARALVTVEREGVLDYFLQTLDGNAPIVSVPIRDTFAPNVYVGVLAVRGRVADIKPTGLVDLGRPAFKLGMAEIDVGWRRHRLDVVVEAEREVYEVRDKATVRVRVKPRNGNPLPKNAEVAVAAVDAGLLELKPNNNWDLLGTMMGPRSNETVTATAQMRVVGKRHYGQKTRPDGGGGGRGTVREVFDSLLLWKGRVALDENGEAVVRIPLNDSLTRFKIVAVASAGEDKFGTGSTSIRTTQSLMIFPGITPLVREGDRIITPFTLRNTTDDPMDLSVSLSVQGMEQAPSPRDVTVPAKDSVMVSWDMTIPFDQRVLRYHLEVRKGDQIADALSIEQKVKPAVPVRALQGTFAQLTEPFTMTARIPDDAVPGRGGMKIEASTSLVDVGLSGVVDYMRSYPYSCFEQQASVAVALGDAARWESLMSRLALYLDGNGLIKYFPRMRRGSVVLSAYILAIAHERGWAVPDGERQRVLRGLRNFVTGRLHRVDIFVEEYMSVVKLQAIEVLSRYEMASPDLLESIEIHPRELPTSALMDWLNILYRVTGIADADRLRSESENLLRSRIRYDGRIMRFTTSERDDLWWLMTDGDSNAIRFLLTAMEFGLWSDDRARLLEGALSRQQKGHWKLTTSNAYGAVALRKFAAAFERETLDGLTRIRFGPETADVPWQDGKTKGEALLPWGGIGERRDLEMRHEGKGAPWVSVLSMAAVPFKVPVDAGFAVRKTITPITRKSEDRWSVGDEIRVHLEIDAPADMTWVVIDDPVPAGAAMMGSGLGGETVIAQQGEETKGRARLAFKEHAFDGMRAYFSFVRQGTWSLDYTYLLNAAGTFQMPPTRVEALYKPEMFGVLPNETFVVEE